VFFLSKVTERELLALIYSSEELGEYDQVNPPVTRAGQSRPNTPVNEYSTETAVTTVTPAQSGNFPIPLQNIILVVVAFAAIGAVLVILKIRGGKGKVKADHDDDEYEQDDDYANDD
jgi:hypothetical protein